MIITRSPLRISLGGGGTDLPSFYQKYGGYIISGAINKFDGHLFKFDFRKKGPCYRCFMPEIPIEKNDCQTEGIFSPVAGIMGSLQANEVLKSILNTEDFLINHVLVFDSLKTEFKKLKISINPGCINKC